MRLNEVTLSKPVPALYRSFLSLVFNILPNAPNYRRAVYSNFRFFFRVKRLKHAPLAFFFVSVSQPSTAGELAARFEVAVRSEMDFAEAISDPDRKLVVCPHRFAVTKDHDFGDKHLILWPEVLDFSGGGTLRGSGSISRVAANADYAVFTNARVGFWEYYSGRVTYEGTNYAPLPGQGTPPSIEGSWNNHERDVTFWKQWHDGRINDAIEAAQNSLPRKGGTLADWSASSTST